MFPGGQLPYQALLGTVSDTLPGTCSQWLIFFSLPSKGTPPDALEQKPRSRQAF